MELPNLSALRIPENLQARFISAGILAPIVLILLYIGGAVYNTMIIAVAVIMSFEWKVIINSGEQELSDAMQQRWNATGIAYITIFASSLIYLRNLENGFGIVLLMLFLVWATDIAAFFTGKALQGPKICTKISPNKTWSGLAGGMIAAGFVGALASVFIPMSTLSLIAIGMLLAIVAQIGDFFESWVKRSFGVKDSGNIIPGHGGLLDRLDGFTTVAPVFVIFTLLN